MTNFLNSGFAKLVEKGNSRMNDKVMPPLMEQVRASG
jgi:hypothetical protein